MQTEPELIEGVKEGKAGAFDEMYLLYSKRLFHFALSVLKSSDDAEEVVQNTFFKIWEKRETMDPAQNLKSFIFTIAYRVTVDLLRERLKVKKYRTNILEKASTNYRIEDSIEYADLLERINQIVKDLPPRKKEIYLLSRVNQLSYNEIAEKLNITVKTVENGINYSMNFIKKRLGENSLLVLLFSSLFI
jgi:RNA polymerase sigma-70 factor (ECF subfamily)